MRAMGQVEARLDGIGEQIWSVGRNRDEPDAGLAEAIGSTIDLGEVLRRTLAAAEAVRAVDGSRISVRRSDGTVATAVHGLAATSLGSAVGGPPDGAPFVSELTSWDVASAEALRASLTVPLGPDRSGSLTVYSRHASAFDPEAVSLLAAIARRAAPAVQDALRYLDVQELAAVRTGEGQGS